MSSRGTSVIDTHWLDPVLDAALPLLDREPEGTYAVVAANDSARTITLRDRPYTTKAAAARVQTLLANEGHRAYMAVRFKGTDYLMGRHGGIDMIYRQREVLA
jgi:hypothetical protein